MISALLVTVAVIYIISKLIAQYQKYKNIPKPYYQIPIIGGSIGHSILVVKMKQYELFDLHQKYGPVMLAGPIGMPTLLVSDPEEIKRIHNNTKLFPRSDFLEKLLVGIMDFGLANIPSGPVHKKHRKILQPAFAPAHLRQVPNACARVFQNVVAKWGSKGTVDFDSEMLKVTLDVLGLIAFGTDLGAVEGVLESTKLWTGLDDFLFHSLVPIRMLFPKIMWHWMGVGLQSPKFNSQVLRYQNFFDDLIDSPETHAKLDRYEDDSKFELNFLERLIIALRQGKLSRKEVYDECLDFVIAGHETSSHTLAFLMWDLCRNPELQNELYETVKDIKDLNNLPPLDLFDRVLKESQRLHTLGVGGIARTATEDTVISGCNIPKGIIIQVSYRALHLNPKYYPSPLEFKPDRWLDPEASNLPFFPFSGGEHACIGQKLALIEIKTMMICFLQKYQFFMTKEAQEAIEITQPLTLKANPQIQYIERL